MKHLVLSDPSISQRLFMDILAYPTSPEINHFIKFPTIFHTPTFPINPNQIQLNQYQKLTLKSNIDI